MVEIPLVGGAGNSHQSFVILLGENLLQFTLNYITVAGPAWSVDVSREGVRLISGAMLEPGAVLTENLNLDIGQLVFTGNPVTVDNLGFENQLIWIAPDEQL